MYVIMGRFIHSLIRPLTVASLLIALMPLWVVAQETPPDPYQATSWGTGPGGEPSEEDGSTGEADTNSPYVGPLPQFPTAHTEQKEPCGQVQRSNQSNRTGLMARDSCPPPSYSDTGYAFGWQFQPDRPNQGVCFRDTSSLQSNPEDPNLPDNRPEATRFVVVGSEKDLTEAPYKTTVDNWDTKWGQDLDLKWDEPLQDAADRYNIERGTNIQLVGNRLIGPDHNFLVAFIDEFREWGTSSVLGVFYHYKWRHSAFQVVNAARRGVAWEVDEISYPKVGINQPTIAYQKWFSWTWNIERRVCDSYQDENGDWHEDCDWEPDGTKSRTGHTKIIDSSGEGVGAGSYEYYRKALKLDVASIRIPPRRPDLPPWKRTTGRPSTRTWVEEKSGVAQGDIPAFWAAWELWGSLTSRETSLWTAGSDIAIAKRIRLGIKKLHLRYSYHISQYTCFVARNGRPLMSWEVEVPWTRQETPTDEFSTAALVGDQLFSPQPQSIPGVESENTRDGSTNAEILRRRQDTPTLTHVPIPLFDVGSGVSSGTEKTPDGNWWASVGTIPEIGKCLQMGRVPACLVMTLRPWRAIWYIEPPPDELRVKGGFTPAPRDVRVCAYSDGKLPLGADQPREPFAISASRYQVQVDPLLPGRRSMMHTLHSLHGTDDPELRKWINEWLYGDTGERQFGQDQTDPDRWCWYAWHQAQSDADGFQGVLAVEWLAAAYLGVPASEYPVNREHYCPPESGPYQGTPSNPASASTFYTYEYDCDVHLNLDERASQFWFSTAVSQWNNPDPETATLNLKWLGTDLSSATTCYVGTRAVGAIDKPFEWYLQAVSVLYENEPEAGPGSREPMHPLGGLSNPKNPKDGGRVPSDSRPHANWWREGSSHSVATPQTGDGSGGLTSLSHNDQWRVYLPDVEALSYPTGLDGTGGDPECDRVPFTVVGLPTVSVDKNGVSTSTWHRLFNEDGQGSEKSGNLWAWWSQQVGELRQRVTPVPVG